MRAAEAGRANSDRPNHSFVCWEVGEEEREKRRESGFRSGGPCGPGRVGAAAGLEGVKPGSGNDQAKEPVLAGAELAVLVAGKDGTLK